MLKKTASIGTAVLLGLSTFTVGCGGKGLGGMGGQIFGDMAAKTAGNMLTGNAQKQAQQQQAGAQQQANYQTPAAYKAPSMDMTGTLAEKKPADGTAGGWTFTEAGSTIATNVDLSGVDKDARKMTGKTVTITGHYDSFGTGAFVVEKVAAAQ